VSLTRLLADEAFQNPRKVLFYAADDASVGSAVEVLIKDNGFEPVNIGGIDQSILDGSIW
jgi:predicted dinucleotide-binding enzyme